MMKTIEEQFDNGELDSEYAEYIMDNCGGDRLICSGHTLLLAQEDGYLAAEFLESLEQMPSGCHCAAAGCHKA
jgi:hypothetical protein